VKYPPYYTPNLRELSALPILKSTIPALPILVLFHILKREISLLRQISVKYPPYYTSIIRELSALPILVLFHILKREISTKIVYTPYLF
jgi:hypothetical protein